MDDLQVVAFRWATGQSAISGFVVLAMGLLFALQGFRFSRVLMALTSGAGGFAIGLIVATIVDLPEIGVAWIAGGAAGALALARYRVGVVLSSTFVCAAAAHFLLSRFTYDASTLLGGLGLGALTGACLQWVCLRSLPVIITCVQGAFLLMVAFVALAGAALPSLATTFVSWADSIPLMTPVMMAMLFTLGYSVQANARQGDMRSGGSRDSDAVELA